MITYYVVVLVIRTHMVLPSILTHVITDLTYKNPYSPLLKMLQEK